MRPWPLSPVRLRVVEELWWQLFLLYRRLVEMRWWPLSLLRFRVVEELWSKPSPLYHMAVEKQ